MQEYEIAADAFRQANGDLIREFVSAGPDVVGAQTAARRSLHFEVRAGAAKGRQRMEKPRIRQIPAGFR